LKKLIYILFFASQFSFGQSPTFKIDSLLNAKMEFLKTDKVGFTRKSCTGFGVDSNAYLFWKTDSITMMQKIEFIEYPKEHLKEYEPIIIKDDFFFFLLTENQNDLRNDSEIKHFQVKTENVQSQGTVSTGYIQTSHSCYRHLYLKSNGFEFKKQFDYFDLAKSLRNSENEKNINYKFNQNIKIVELDKIINNRINDIESKTELKITKRN